MVEQLMALKAPLFWTAAPETGQLGKGVPAARDGSRFYIIFSVRNAADNFMRKPRFPQFSKCGVSVPQGIGAQGVDGPDKPGHDGLESMERMGRALLWRGWGFGAVGFTHPTGRWL